MQTLNGRWKYRSFCPRPAFADGPAQLAAPWAPLGVLTAQTDAAGNISGTLQFAPTLELTVRGSLTPASARERLSEGIELTAEGLGATYVVRGYFLAGSAYIVGTVLCQQGDLARQPPGTLGAFVLLPE